MWILYQIQAFFDLKDFYLWTKSSRLHWIWIFDAEILRLVQGHDQKETPRGPYPLKKSFTQHKIEIISISDRLICRDSNEWIKTINKILISTKNESNIPPKIGFCQIFCEWKSLTAEEKKLWKWIMRTGECFINIYLSFLGISADSMNWN